MKDILLLAATALEIPNFLGEKAVADIKAGEIIEISQKPRIRVMLTGPGIPATMYFLTRLLDHNSFDLAINAGIAGSFREDLALGTAVHITRDAFPELGAWHHEQFIPFYEMEMAQPYRPSFINKNAEIENTSFPILNAIADLPKVSGLSVNTISSQADAFKHLADGGADVESMEGAAFFWCCAGFKIPCLQLRTISNHIFPSHLSCWDIPLAVQNLQLILKNIFDELR